MPKKNQFNKIIIVSPADAITGGPEALHQLAFKINQLGGDAYLIYYDGANPLNFDGASIFSKVNNGVGIDEYSKYKPRIINEVKLTKDDLLIVPEIFSHIACQNTIYSKAIWWLSVDNALLWNSDLKYSGLTNSVFTDRSVYHLYQSAYARDFLLKMGAKKVIPMYDYSGLPEWTTQYSRSYDVSFFPRKGANLANLFFHKITSLNLNIIQNMTKREVYDSLCKSKIYIDFGDQPGKDRVPREAAHAGNVIFLHYKGAASYYEDSPLDDYFLFTESDIRSGILHKKIYSVLDCTQPYLDRQEYYREKIFVEENEFNQQVKTFFLRNILNSK